MIKTFLQERVQAKLDSINSLYSERIESKEISLFAGSLTERESVMLGIALVHLKVRIDDLRSSYEDLLNSIDKENSNDS